MLRYLMYIIKGHHVTNNDDAGQDDQNSNAKEICTITYKSLIEDVIMKYDKCPTSGLDDYDHLIDSKYDQRMIYYSPLFFFFFSLFFCLFFIHKVLKIKRPVSILDEPVSFINHQPIFISEVISIRSPGSL